MALRFTVLGTGTSSGVPTIGCTCSTCLSDDPRDKRLRTSLLVQSETTTVVIDTSADFRQQMLTHNIRALDAVVYTHHHFDHISGFDDVRAFNFVQKKSMPIYLLRETLLNLQNVFGYAFGKAEQVGGGLPMVSLNIIDQEPFTIGDITFQPIPLQHGILRVNGYRIGNVAYCTDTNFIPEESYQLLNGVEYCILDALRYHPHPTHFTVDEALVAARRIGAKKTYFTHIAHQLHHKTLLQELPPNIEPAYDGLSFQL